MTWGRKTGGRNFKPGEGGRKPDSPEMKAIRHATREDLLKWFRFFAMSPVEVIDSIDIKKQPLFVAGMMQSFLKFRKSGDFDYLKYCLDQILGKAKEYIEIEETQPIDQKEYEEKYKKIIKEAKEEVAKKFECMN